MLLFVWNALFLLACKDDIIGCNFSGMKFQQDLREEIIQTDHTSNELEENISIAMRVLSLEEKKVFHTPFLDWWHYHGLMYA